MEKSKYLLKFSKNESGKKWKKFDFCTFCDSYLLESESELESHLESCKYKNNQG